MNTRQYSQASTTKLTLKEYFDAIGADDPFFLQNVIGISKDAINAALKGKPIALSYAQKIAQYLSREFDRDIQVSDIKELKTVNPGREKGNTSKQ